MARLCVIFNPAAGKNRAGQRLEKLRQSWTEPIEFRPTDRAGHAVELARQSALDGFDIVIAAGGDGTVHEVANGLLLSDRRDVRFAVLPIGSANDYAHSLFHRDKGPVVAVDVGRVRADGREKYFVCCFGMGFNGSVTVESRRIRWLQGIALYGLATLRALGGRFGCPPMEVHLDGDPTTTPTLMLSLMLGRREGGFVIAPRAELDDGWFDYFQVGAMSRWQVLRLLPQLAWSGSPESHPKIRQGRCRHVRLKCEQPLNVHLDGEFLHPTGEALREIDVELLPARLLVDVELSRRLETG